MERDPHQLIEGVAHRLLRHRRRAGLPLRPGRDGAGPGAHRRRRSTTPTPPATSARTSSAPTSPSTSSCTGAPAPTSSARRRRSSSASRATGACPGSSRRSSPPPRASTCSPRSSTTSRRCPTCRGSCTNGGAAFAALGAETSPGHPHVRGVRPRQAARRLRGRVRRHHLPRPDLRRPSYGGGIRDGNAAQGVHPRRRVGAVVLRGAPRPAARGRRGRRGRLDARLGRHRRDGRHHRHGARPAWRLVRFFARESCGKCTPCREGTTWLEKILRRIARRPRPPGRPRPAARRLRQHQPRRSPGRPKQTTICPLGPVRGVAHRLGGHALPRRVRRLLRRHGRDHRRRSTARPTCSTPADRRRSPRDRHQPRRPRPCSRHRRRQGRSRPARASWSSTPPSATASTSRASATTRG